MFRSLTATLHCYTNPFLSLGPYSTATKIAELFLAAEKAHILSKSSFYNKISKECGLDFEVKHESQFIQALGQALTIQMNLNYRFYQKLMEDKKNIFRTAIATCLSDLLREDASSMPQHKFDLICEGIILTLNLPDQFTCADYLETKLAAIIQETIKALIKDQIDTLYATNTQMSRLPKEVCNIIGNMLFFQLPKQDIAQAEPKLEIPSILKK